METARAIAVGDPPSLPSAYTSALYTAAPYFQAVKTLNSYSAPRPVTPNYLQVSSDLQTLFSSVYANGSPNAASAAFAAGAASIKSDAAATPGSLAPMTAVEDTGAEGRPARAGRPALVKRLTPARRPNRPVGHARETGDRRLGYMLVAPVIILLLAITAYPLIYNIWNAFHFDNLSLREPAAQVRRLGELHRDVRVLAVGVGA